MVTAAALDRVPGATVLRVESGGHGGAAYRAHVRKAGGTQVVVLVDHGGPGETALTGDAAARARICARSA